MFYVPFKIVSAHESGQSVGGGGENGRPRHTRKQNFACLSHITFFFLGAATRRNPTHQIKLLK